MDGGFTQSQNLKSMATPNLNALDFPALPVTDSGNRFTIYSRDNIQQTQDLYRYRPPSSLFRGPPDFASAVRKLASQDNGTWKLERNGSVDGFGSSGVNRQLLTNSYKGHGKLAHENKLQGLGAAQAGPVWLDTGEAVGSYLLFFAVFIDIIHSGFICPEINSNWQQIYIQRREKKLETLLALEMHVFNR